MLCWYHCLIFGSHMYNIDHLDHFNHHDCVAPSQLNLGNPGMCPTLGLRQINGRRRLNVDRQGRLQRAQTLCSGLELLMGRAAVVVELHVLEAVELGLSHDGVALGPGLVLCDPGAQIGDVGLAVLDAQNQNDGGYIG